METEALVAKVHIATANSLQPTVDAASGDVCDDLQAISIFLDSYSRKSPHTVRSYEKECLRFHLWLKATRDPSPVLLPNVTVQDINAYLSFLENPQPFSTEFLTAHGWKHQPFRKRLSDESVKLCLTVLHKLFTSLRELRASANLPYCMFNPVKLAHAGSSTTTELDEVEEALTAQEWASVRAVIEELPKSTARELKHYHRARWIFQLLYRAFLRRDEAANLRMNSFELTRDGWVIRLIGKGAKKAKIVATAALVDELTIYRISLGMTALPSPSETSPAILAVTGKNKGVTAQTIYLLCMTIYEMAAKKMESIDKTAAARLRQATPHWMRHTGVTHAMESGVGPRYVQAQARHSSLNVTARYDHKERIAWRQNIEKM